MHTANLSLSKNLFGVETKQHPYKNPQNMLHVHREIHIQKTNLKFQKNPFL